MLAASVLLQTGMCVVLLFLLAFLSCATAQGILHLDDSEPCAPIGHITRTCKSLEECPHAMNGIRVRQFPEVCGFHGAQPRVCCPNFETTTTLRPTDEGAICENGPPPWYCKLHSACPGIHEAIKNHRFPKICSFRGSRNPIVCCPPSDTTSTTTYRPPWMLPNGQSIWTESGGPTSESTVTLHTGRIPGKKSVEMCKEYAKYVYKKIPLISLPGRPDNEQLMAFCGRVVQPLIVKGEDAGPREFPHMARIGYGPENKIKWLCGGSLISERYILSAAHCTSPPGGKLKAGWANLGDLDVSTEVDDAQPVTIKIIETIDHPGYSEKLMYHDISLYKLAKDAPLGIYIRPICLYTKKTIPNPKATASGWGHLSYKGNNPSAKLQKVDLNMVSNKHCNDSYRINIQSKDSQLPQGIVSDYMICAGGVDGKDTCQGDSGGPLQIAQETPYCTYAIIGITSFGRACGTNTPAVYTNVANYVKWIEDIVWPA